MIYHYRITVQGVYDFKATAMHDSYASPPNTAVPVLPLMLTTHVLTHKNAFSQVETLVTIHVHQRDVMNDLATLHRQKRISDANDFEWLKQVIILLGSS